MTNTVQGTSQRRRRLLRATGAGVASLTLLTPTGPVAGQESSQVSVEFNDQTTNGREIVIAEVKTAVDVLFTVATDRHETTFAQGQLDAGTDLEDYTVTLSKTLTQERTLEVSLYPADGGEALAMDKAKVSVGEDIEYIDGLSVTRVDADPEAGFNYPYFLWAPSIPRQNTGNPILVAPNNTGTSTDDFDAHQREARELIKHGNSRDVSGQLGVPMLVPVFPRPESDPVDWHHYTHQLDRDTLQISSGPLERIDLQLLRMVEHAQKKLADASYPVADDIIMDGFSASGNFVDRFAVLHPDRVLSVTAGGLNGMALLPLEKAKNHTLNYHIGIADVEDITGSPVNLDALSEVNQFLYMGSQDSSDTIPYDDAWTSEKMRQTALDVYGQDMIENRFPYCQTAYENAGVEAQFRVYDGVGHTPRPAKEDIIRFHRRSIEGKDVSSFGQQLGLQAAFSPQLTNPDAGESVKFSATESEAPRGKILAYTWKFSDGETAAGDVVRHTFTEPGDYTIELSVVDDMGRTATAAVSMTVGRSDSTSTGTETKGGQTSTTDTINRATSSEPSGTETTSAQTSTIDTTNGPTSSEPSGTETTSAQTSTIATTNGPTNAKPSSTTSSRGAPGFGIGTAVTSLVGIGYLVKRRMGGNSEGDTDE